MLGSNCGHADYQFCLSRAVILYRVCGADYYAALLAQYTADAQRHLGVAEGSLGLPDHNLREAELALFFEELP